MHLCLTFSCLCFRFDVAVAIGFALLFFMLVFSSLMTLYLRHFWLFGVVICFNIFLPTRLRMSRQTLARNRERRLPLSIWEFILVVSCLYTGRQGLISRLLINLVFRGYSWCSKILSRMQLFPASFWGRDGIHLHNLYTQTKWTCGTLVSHVKLMKLSPVKRPEISVALFLN